MNQDTDTCVRSIVLTEKVWIAGSCLTLSASAFESLIEFFGGKAVFLGAVTLYGK